MNILILGASGFIGNAIFLSLVQNHKVTIASRTPVESYTKWKKLDFSEPFDINYLLDDIDLVINAIGIIEGDFEHIHTRIPIEIYKHCIKKNIKIIHISAIGAEKDSIETTFLYSKKITDNFLLKYAHAKVIYPGIVIGAKGKSTQFFAEIVQFPIIPLFSEKPLPFVHISQLTGLIRSIVSDFENFPQQIFAVSKPEPLKNIFSAIKGEKIKFVKIPESIFSVLFWIFPKISIGIFNKATFKMFQITSATNYTALFPEVSKIINPLHIKKSDVFPQLFALLAISFIWVFSGISSLISWNKSYELMNEIGANHFFSLFFIILGSFTDIVLGIVLFIKKYRKHILILQIAVMIIYMLILTALAPHYWLHPLGVLSKNIPLIALSYYLITKQD
ncbi:MAG: SDR family oxidoreductase [Bacteroidales bacterium]|nr:SDR family oxidoreductase [Bacteroidales bacterium]